MGTGAERAKWMEATAYMERNRLDRQIATDAARAERCGAC
jgi:hypothetical protein